MNAKKSSKKVISIIYYSMYGHTEILARKIAEGVNSIEGCTAQLWQVPETLNDSILGLMKAPSKPTDIPVLTFNRIPEIVESDGFIFGTPTRFGSMATQLKTFFDSLGSYWVKGSFQGKPCGMFFSTGTQGGGQETTALTTLTQFAHLGMVFVPIGYAYGKEYLTMNEVRGGSPWGSGTFAGDGTRQVSELEQKIAVFQGEYMGKYCMKNY